MYHFITGDSEKTFFDIPQKIEVPFEVKELSVRDSCVYAVTADNDVLFWGKIWMGYFGFNFKMNGDKFEDDLLHEKHADMFYTYQNPLYIASGEEICLSMLGADNDSIFCVNNNQIEEYIIEYEFDKKKKVYELCKTKYVLPGVEKVYSSEIMISSGNLIARPLMSTTFSDCYYGVKYKDLVIDSSWWVDYIIYDNSCEYVLGSKNPFLVSDEVEDISGSLFLKENEM